MEKTGTETSGMKGDGGEGAMLRLIVEVPTSLIGATALGEGIAQLLAANYAGAIVTERQVTAIPATESDPQPSEPEADSWSRLLDKDVEEAMREKDISQQAPTRYVNSLRRGGISTLRDLLVAGRNYIGHVPRSGHVTQEVADEIIEAYGLEDEWLDEPTIEDIAGWCKDLSQVSDLVVWRDRSLLVYAKLEEHLAVNQLWERDEEYVGDRYILEQLLDAQEVARLTEERRSRLVWNVKYQAAAFADRFLEVKARQPRPSS